jgi:hypothetical protein
MEEKRTDSRFAPQPEKIKTSLFTISIGALLLSLSEFSLLLGLQQALEVEQETLVVHLGVHFNHIIRPELIEIVVHRRALSIV